MTGIPVIVTGIRRLQRRLGGELDLRFDITLILAISTLAATACTPNDPRPQQTAIDRAIEDSTRPESERVLDESRHPADVLLFAGVEPGWAVADLTAGSGYYSRVLSTAVGENGHVWSHNPTWIAERFTDMNMAMAQLAETRTNMTYVVEPIEDFANDIEVPLDAVFMVLFYHDTAWDGTDRAAMNQAIFDALKPGGVFLVIDHHAPDGSGVQFVNDTHRIEARIVLEEVTAAGFELIENNAMLANEADQRVLSVFDPSLRRRTDRFVYLFQKPL